MSRVLKNIHLLFWGVIPIFLLYGFFNFEEYVDINIHDTMIVIAVIHLMIFISIIFLVTGFGYFLSYKREKFKLNKLLTLAHVVITFLGILLILIFSLKSFSEIGWHTDLNAIYRYENYKLFTLLIVVLAQFLLAINLIISF